MIFVLIFGTALLCATGFALFAGGRPERTGATAIFVAACLSVPSTSFYASPETGLLLIDILLLGVFLWLLASTDRYWPIWAVGFQLVTVTTHLAKMLQPDVVAAAYANFADLWAYPIMAALTIGTFQHRRRLRGMIDRDTISRN